MRTTTDITSPCGGGGRLAAPQSDAGINFNTHAAEEGNHGNCNIHIRYLLMWVLFLIPV